MKGVAQNANRLAASTCLPSAWQLSFLFSTALFLCAASLNAQCPDTGQTTVIKPNEGTGYYFYRFLGDSSFRYFLDGKTFSFNDKDDPDRTIISIDDMAYESILVNKADFANYINGPKPIDILRAHAKYEQDHYKKLVPSIVITDFGPPSKENADGADDRAFYLWKKENPPGKEAATQYLLSALLKDRVVLLSIMVLKPSVSEAKVFHQIHKYTSNLSLISSAQCAKVLSMPIAP